MVLNFRIFLLALATFVTGTAENIIVGILPDISSGLGISRGLAGQLTSAFSVTFAVAAPAVLLLTNRYERRLVFLGAMGVFVAASLLAASSPGYAFLFAARIGMALASAAVCVVATMMATELAGPEMRGRAIGVIFMGISGSLVLGVPAGMFVSGHLGWRSVFLLLALLAALVLVLSWVVMSRTGISTGKAPGYRNHLSSWNLVAAQLVSVTMIGGHFTLFAYLAPYLLDIAGFAQGELFLAFLAFGISGVTGGHLGGRLADLFSPGKALVITTVAYLAALAAIPAALEQPVIQVVVLMVWGCISWMISPVVQGFLIAEDPEGSEAGIGLNFSAMHIGVGLGTALGGVAVDWDLLETLPWLGAGLAVLAVGLSVVATRSRIRPVCSMP